MEGNSYGHPESLCSYMGDGDIWLRCHYFQLNSRVVMVSHIDNRYEWYLTPLHRCRYFGYIYRNVLTALTLSNVLRDVGAFVDLVGKALARRARCELFLGRVVEAG